MSIGPFFTGIDFYSDTVTRPSKGMREALGKSTAKIIGNKYIGGAE